MPDYPRIAANVAKIAVPLICGFEGLFLYAYRDPVGIPTICFGHIEDVRMGDRKTKAECEDLLLDDLPRYEAGVQRCIHVPMTAKRHAAILSFTYNVGEGALCKSSVARKLNAGDIQGGCTALLLYNRAGGRVLPGLVKRRQEERRLCLAEDEIVVAVPMPPEKPRAVEPEVQQPKVEPPKLKWYERARLWFKRIWRELWSG